MEDRMKVSNAAVVLLAAGALAACGGGGGAASPEVASLDEQSATTDTANDESDESEPTPEDREEALLDYAQCMRDHGVDMPDPQISEDGSGGILIEQREGSGMDPESEEFQAAQKECESILEDGMGAIELDPEQQAEMQERLLEFAECMRDHGIDMPDPVFGEDGRVEIQANGPGGDAEPSQDPREDDDFQAAQEACQDEMGPGGPFGPTGTIEDEGEGE
jgi:hypothetical protein